MRKPGLWILYSATLLKPGNFRHPSCAGSTCILVFLNILRYCLVLCLLRYHCLVIASSSCSVRVSDVWRWTGVWYDVVFGFYTLLRKPAARLGGEVFFCEQSELRGLGPWGQSVPKVPEITELGGVELFKHFEGHVPGGNWVTVGYRFPLGPSLEVHFGGDVQGKRKGKEGEYDEGNGTACTGYRTQRLFFPMSFLARWLSTVHRSRPRTRTLLHTILCWLFYPYLSGSDVGPLWAQRLHKGMWTLLSETDFSWPGWSFARNGPWMEVQ